VIGWVQDPGIAGFGGQQQKGTNRDHAAIPLSSSTLDITHFIGEPERLSIDPLFSSPALDLEPPHSMRS
jgi:hypothetical protein